MAAAILHCSWNATLAFETYGSAAVIAILSKGFAANRPNSATWAFF